MTTDSYKRAAAARAIDFVRSGMRLGLGTGSTAQHFVELLAERVRAGLDVIAVPTSEATRAQAKRLGIALATLDDVTELDLTVDGADEIGPDLTLIKGGGGALLREKIVATRANGSMCLAVSRCRSKLLPSARRRPAGRSRPQRRARTAPDRPSYGGIATATLLSRMAGTGSLMRNWAASPIRRRWRAISPPCPA